jgi:quercetin dioxygenase-like cupin family protein
MSQRNQNGIERIPLLTAELAKEYNIARVEIKKISFRPLQRTGFHLHPCPVVGYIARGSIYFQIEGESAKNLSQGDAFYEPANKNILHFDNSSPTEAADFVAFYLLGKDEKELIRMLS